MNTTDFSLTCLVNEQFLLIRQSIIVNISTNLFLTFKNSYIHSLGITTMQTWTAEKWLALASWVALLHELSHRPEQCYPFPCTSSRKSYINFFFSSVSWPPLHSSFSYLSFPLPFAFSFCPKKSSWELSLAGDSHYGSGMLICLFALDAEAALMRISPMDLLSCTV